MVLEAFHVESGRGASEKGTVVRDPPVLYRNLLDVLPPGLVDIIGPETPAGHPVLQQAVVAWFDEVTMALAGKWPESGSEGGVRYCGEIHTAGGEVSFECVDWGMLAGRYSGNACARVLVER